MVRYVWRDFLERWFRDVLAYREQDALDMLPPELVRSRWLGELGATETQLAAAEDRLGAALPPSYRGFLTAANGCWLVSGYWFAYPFWSTELVEWFALRNQEWIDAWLKGYHWYGPQAPVTDEEYLVYGPAQWGVFREEYLQTMLEVSGQGKNDSIYLLNPQIVTAEGEWEAWYFNHDEITRYQSFWEMLQAAYQRFLSVRALEGKRLL